MKRYNVLDFGAVADGTTLCTAAVQKAIDHCHANGGGIVRFEGGRYVLSTVFLKSNVHISLTEDTVILGALSFYDYAQQEKVDYPIYQDASHTYYDLSMFVGKNCENISITGKCHIDMRSVWDEDGVRGKEIKHRGPKCIALKECKNVEISGLEIVNATDLAVYFAGCENVDVHGLKMRVYIDGISPDNSKNVRIYDCDVETGDDGIVFKSSYTLNRLDICKNIRVWGCRVKSRCTAIKFGTETNGGFEDIEIRDIDVRETRITGIAIESVDGAIIDGITIKNVKMKNVNAPLFIHIGKRMRGPAGRAIGQIKNITLENITAEGPYEPYEVISWNYFSYKANDVYQYPWIFGLAENFDDTEAHNTAESDWQMTSNVCGLPDNPLQNITLRNVHLKLDGGVKTYKREVPEEAQDYPEVYVYGRILPAKGIYFRHVDGLTLENVTVETYREDAREDFVFDDVKRSEDLTGVWAEACKGQMNVALAFVLDLEEEQEFDCRLTAADCYKVYTDGEFLAFGPQRAAHGYARVANYKGKAKRIVVEVHSHNVQTFCWIKQQPFFACEIIAGDKTYTAEDFTCYRLTDRVQAVQRYSYQRGFAEIYRMSEDRKSLHQGGANFPKMQTQRVPVPVLLPSYVDEPKYEIHFPVAVIEKGGVERDEKAPVWRDRAHNLVGTKLQGFVIDEWEESLTDEASKFVYKPNEKTASGLTYTTHDFGRAITGFSQLKVKAEKAGVVYLVFDEILWHEAGKGENYVSFSRNSCSSVQKFIFEKAGEYEVSAFDPYLMRYVVLVCSEGVEAEVSLRDYQNPNADGFTVDCTDARIQKIVEAAKATFVQNATDILMDCPSRERAGWLSDSYFSSEAEYILTGKNQAEKTFLENYACADCSGLPEGMVPMCYPSDPYDTFIPNWAMWYCFELEKYAKRWGRDEIIEKSKEKIDGLLRYFKSKENEFGLLEDLDGWVFVEWSVANSADHIKGVNIPSNIAYASCLEAVANLYGYEGFRQQANDIRTFIKKYAYNGRFFVDNLVRNGRGELQQSGLLSEVCQYYAFWFRCITKEEYPTLYAELMERLGVNRAEGYLPEMGTSNVLYGLYMRIDLLMRAGEKQKVLDECIKLFLPMAERTGTLWEHNGIMASCDHGFASYALKWILFALS